MAFLSELPSEKNVNSYTKDNNFQTNAIVSSIWLALLAVTFKNQSF